jgi:hypothetical protein
MSSITNCYFSPELEVNLNIQPTISVSINNCCFHYNYISGQIDYYGLTIFVKFGEMSFEKDNQYIQFGKKDINIFAYDENILIKEFSIFLMTFLKISKPIQFIHLLMDCLFVKTDFENIEINDNRDVVNDNIDIKELFEKIISNIKKLIILI